jgi:hypothetical protein
MGYELSPTYDYKGNWNHRAKTLPRFGTHYTKDHKEVLASFEDCRKQLIHQVADSLANLTWKDWSISNLKKNFKYIIEREKYNIVLENAYGFGWYYFGDKTDHDIEKEVFEDLWDAIQPELRASHERWWKLHLQCDSVNYSTKETFEKANQLMINEIYTNFIEEDFESLKKDEYKRVANYCAEETMWIRRSGGYRGD